MKAANKHRKSSLEYKVGNKVWFSTKNIYIEQKSKKLDHKQIGFYPKELVNLSYWLELSTLMQIHDLFYPNLLRLAAKNLLPGQYNDPLSPIIVNDKKK